jgi:hypothetical protein
VRRVRGHAASEGRAGVVVPAFGAVPARAAVAPVLADGTGGRSAGVVGRGVRPAVLAPLRRIARRLRLSPLCLRWRGRPLPLLPLGRLRLPLPLPLPLVPRLQGRGQTHGLLGSGKLCLRQCARLQQLT